jgi:RNA polymerase sigma factor (sigma-70 family)
LEKPCPEKGRFRSYLIGILKNIKRQEEHKKRRTALFSLEIILESQEEAEIQASPLTAEELFHQEWAKQTVYLALKQMESEYKNSTEKPERQKALKAFKQHFLEEKPIQEIAQELQCPAPWVSEKIYRLKKKYRNALQQIVQDTLFPGENIEEELADLLHLLAKK